MANFAPEGMFLHEGNQIDYTPSGAAVAAGEVVNLTTMIGVATAAIPDGRQGALAVEGVLEFPKEAALAIAVGDACYWDDTAKEIDKTNTNVAAGKCVRAAADTDTKVWVKLAPGMSVT